MKKIITLLLLLPALCTSAWEYDFPTLEDATTYVGQWNTPIATPSVIASDGTLYQTGLYDYGQEFGADWLDNIATSAFISAIDTVSHAPKWTVGIQGAAHITHIVAAPTDGSIYVAGTFADDIWMGSTDYTNHEFTGTLETHEQANTFVARYSKDGLLLDAQIIVPITKADTVLTENPIAVTPSALALHSGRLYLSVAYVGGYSFNEHSNTSPSQRIQGNAYPSMGLAAFSFNAENLKDDERIIDVQGDATSVNNSLGPRSICLTASENGVDIALFATGKVLLTFTPWKGTRDVKTYDFKQDGISGIMMVRLAEGKHTEKQFKGKESEYYGAYARNSIRSMHYADGKLYMAGNLATPLPFQTDISPKLFTDQFALCLNASDYSVVWARITGTEREDLGEGVDKSPWYLNTIGATLAGKDYIVIGKRNFLLNEEGQASDFSSDFCLGLSTDTKAMALATKTETGSKLTVSPYTPAEVEDQNPYDLDGDGSLTPNDIRRVIKAYLGAE